MVKLLSLLCVLTTGVVFAQVPAQEPCAETQSSINAG